MSCSPFDLRDYFLNELPDTERRQMDAHVKICAACQEEVDRLRLTETALFAVHDEEIPQRIAFVSDPVFERSPWRRWFDAFWASAARLGFASAAMLSTAILVYAFARPAPAPVINVPAPPAPVIISDANVQRLISELNDAQARLQTAAAEFERVQKRAAATYVASAGYGLKPLQPGDAR
jgi:hypothetical protein